MSDARSPIETWPARIDARRLRAGGDLVHAPGVRRHLPSTGFDEAPGHSSLKVTTDIYGYWKRAERKLQAAKMEGAFPV